MESATKKGRDSGQQESEVRKTLTRRTWEGGSGNSITSYTVSRLSALISVIPLHHQAGGQSDGSRGSKGARKLDIEGCGLSWLLELPISEAEWHHTSRQ